MANDDDEDAWVAEWRKSNLLADSMDEWLARKAFQQMRAQARPSRPRRAAARKQSLRSLIKQAERAGKTVNSIERDGVTLGFGERAAGTNQQDEVEAWVKKHAH